MIDCAGYELHISVHQNVKILAQKGNRCSKKWLIWESNPVLRCVRAASLPIDQCDFLRTCSTSLPLFAESCSPGGPVREIGATLVLTFKWASKKGWRNCKDMARRSISTMRVLTYLAWQWRSDRLKSAKTSFLSIDAHFLHLLNCQLDSFSEQSFACASLGPD